MSELRAVALRADDHVPHRLHSADRPWPETNCYLDLWIELLHAIGCDPQPLLGVAVALDWEADHFTFLKPPPRIYSRRRASRCTNWRYGTTLRRT